MMFDNGTMIAAMRSNDGDFDGKFYVGVHSTGIYCLPSCKAKLPLMKNVVFYGTREEAIAAGLRGCKRCRSAEYPDILPPWVDEVIGYMRDHCSAKLNENDLIRLTTVDISTVRRYFKEHLGVTPLAYHRRLRLERARRLLKAGQDQLAVAYDSGFESSSGFREAFVRQFGHTPGRINAQR